MSTGSAAGIDRQPPHYPAGRATSLGSRRLPDAAVRHLNPLVDEISVLPRSTQPAFACLRASIDRRPSGHTPEDRNGRGLATRLPAWAGNGRKPFLSCLCGSSPVRGTALSLLGTTHSIAKEHVTCKEVWWTWPGSNRRPLRCERNALPTELRARNKVGGRGFEPHQRKLAPRLQVFRYPGWALASALPGLPVRKAHPKC